MNATTTGTTCSSRGRGVSAVILLFLLQVFVVHAATAATATATSGAGDDASDDGRSSIRRLNHDHPTRKEDQPEESHSFPSVYAAVVTRTELVSTRWKERLAALDLLHVGCTSTTSSKQRDDDNDNCRVQALLHSADELDYFYSSSSLKKEDGISSPFFELDRDATEALVWAPQRRRHLQDINLSLPDASNNFTRIPDYSCFLDYAGMMDWIQTELVDKTGQAGQEGYFPDWLNMELLDIGDSYLKTVDPSKGHDIHALKISSNTTTSTKKKAPLLILTGIHPREYAPPELVRRWLLHSIAEPLGGNNATSKSFTDTRAMLDSTDIYWIPYGNPDGRVLAESDSQQWFRRKNLNRVAAGNANCRQDEYGVDLNRNFPFRWGRSDGSTDRPCLQTYRGTSPGSEPEVQAVVQLGLSIFSPDQRLPEGTFDNPNTNAGIGYNESTTSGIFLDIHSFGNYYIYPWGFENSQTPNHDGLDAMTRKFQYFTDYSINGPGQAYTSPASGATDDWAYATLGAAGMTWEVGANFHQECGTFERSVVASNIAALDHAAKLAPLPYHMAKGPDIVNLEMTTTTTITTTNTTTSSTGTNTTDELMLQPGQDLTVSFLASDSIYLNPSYALAAQGTESVRVFLDQHPYHSGESGTTTMGVTTGTPNWVLNSNQIGGGGEGAFTWNWETLEAHWRRRFLQVAGRHVFYFEAVDTDGFRGPISAIAVHVVAGAEEEAATASSSSTLPSDMPTLFPSAMPTAATTSTATTTTSAAVSEGCDPSVSDSPCVSDPDTANAEERIADTQLLTDASSSSSGTISRFRAVLFALAVSSGTCSVFLLL